VEFIATIRYLKKKGYEESKYYCWKMNEDKDIKWKSTSTTNYWKNLNLKTLLSQMIRITLWLATVLPIYSKKFITVDWSK
jgi:hypothetical protein